MSTNLEHTSSTVRATVEETSLHHRFVTRHNLARPVQLAVLEFAFVGRCAFPLCVCVCVCV